MRCGSRRAADAAEAHHLQRDLPGRIRPRPLDRSANRPSNGRSTTCSASRTGPGRATTALERRRRSLHRLRQSRLRAPRPVARGTAIDAHGQGDIARHRRIGPARRGCAASCIGARSLCRRHRDSRRAALRDRALAARAREHPQDRCDARRAARRASSPSSPAPTWRPTVSARCGRCGRSAAPTAAPMAEPPRCALARDRVRHVGEPVAIVIAETREQALDAAELVDVDYAPLPAVIDARVAEAAARRNCTRRRPAMSAFAGRAATKPPSARRLQKRRACRRGSTSSTTA